MNRKKVQNAGKVFGEYCKRFGATFGTVGCILSVNEDLSVNENNIVNKGGILLLIISLLIYLYGAWRTQNFMIELKEE